MASSCFHHCTAMKPQIRRTKMTRRAMMRPLPHAYLLPPHCRASSKQMMAGKKSAVPSRSNFLSCCMKVASVFAPRRWMVKKGMMNAAVTAPRGRLMKKHQRHVR